MLTDTGAAGQFRAGELYVPRRPHQTIELISASISVGNNRRLRRAVFLPPGFSCVSPIALGRDLRRKSHREVFSWASPCLYV